MPKSKARSIWVILNIFLNYEVNCNFGLKSTLTRYNFITICKEMSVLIFLY